MLMVVRSYPVSKESTMYVMTRKFDLIVNKSNSSSKLEFDSFHRKVTTVNFISQ